MVHEHKAAALPCVVGHELWMNGHGRRQGMAVACGQQASCATTRTASRKRAQPRAQRAQARVPRALHPAIDRAQLLARTASDGSRAHRAMARALRALASAHSERWLACVKRWRARSKHHSVRWLAMGMQQLCDERMGCAHMASNGCVRAAHGRATRRVFALRLDRFECLI